MEESIEQPDQPPPTKLTICGDVDVDFAWLEERAVAALCYLQKKHSEISVRVVDDVDMAELHVKHSGVKGTTDVLTFDHGSKEDSIHADIAVCIDVANREAASRGHTVENELLLYIVHGILHCSGFDDNDEDAHQHMHAEEDRILSAIGVGCVWNNQT